MDLAYPSCQTIFVLQMRTQLLGTNTRGMYVFVYYQLCPNCKEPVIGVKEQKDLDALNIIIKDLITKMKDQKRLVEVVLG
jgi:hypothetical protein